MSDLIPTKWHTWTDPKTGETMSRATAWITPEGQAKKDKEEQMKRDAYERIKDRSSTTTNEDTGEKTITMSPKDYDRAMELQQEINEAQVDRDRIIREKAEAERIENLQRSSVTVDHEPLANVGDASGPYLETNPDTGRLELMNYNPPVQMKKSEETDEQRFERLRQEYYDQGGKGEPDIGKIEATVTYKLPIVETIIKKTPHIFPEQINPATGLPFSEKVFGPTPDQIYNSASHWTVAQFNKGMDFIEDISGGLIDFDQPGDSPSLSYGRQVIVRTEEGIYPTNVYTPTVDSSNIFELIGTFSSGRLALMEGPPSTPRSTITNLVGGFASNIEKKIHFITGQPQAMTIMESQPEMGASAEAGLGYWSAELGTWVLATELISAGARVIARSKMVGARGVGKIQQDIVQIAIDKGVDYTAFLSPAGSGPPVGSGGEIVNVVINPAVNILQNIQSAVNTGFGIGIGAVSVGAGVTDVVNIFDLPGYEKRTRTEIRRDFVNIPGDITLPETPSETWDKTVNKNKKIIDNAFVDIDESEFIDIDETDHGTGFIVDEIIINQDSGTGYGQGNVNEIIEEIGVGEELINEDENIQEIINEDENVNDIINQDENIGAYEYVNEYETDVSITDFEFKPPGLSFTLPELPSPVFPKLGKLSGKFPSKNKRLYQPSLYALVKGIKKTGKIPGSSKKYSGLEMRPIIVSKKDKIGFMVRKSDLRIGKRRVLSRRMPGRRTMIKIPTRMPRLSVNIPKKKKKQKLPGMKTPRFKIPKMKKLKIRRIKI